MRRAALLVCAAIASGFSDDLRAQTGAGRPQATIMRLPRSDGRWDLWVLTDERRSGLPRWDPESASEPPLSMGGALRAAQAWLGERHPGRKLELTGVNLAAYGGTWAYQLRFAEASGQSGGASPPLAGRGTTLPLFAAVVLLDGSVLEPRIEESLGVGPPPKPPVR